MAGLARFFVSDRYRGPLLALIWIAVFSVCMVVVVWVTIFNVRETLRAESEETLSEFIRLRTNVLSTFGKMDEWLTAAPCTADYMEQLRRVAYLPDGINEFFHLQDGQIECSVNAGALSRPFVIGPPDILPNNPYGVAFWLDRDLAFLSLSGLTGTLAVRGNHGMVIPAQNSAALTPPWMLQEVLLRAPDGQWWHRSGTPGLYEVAREIGATPFPYRGSFYHTACDHAGLHCVTSRAPISGILDLGAVTTVLIVLGTAVFAAMTTSVIHTQLQRYWAFEARFRRHLAQGVMCTYQPILSVRTGEIVGCEVLVRWRDLDGAIVFPDAFLPIVEKEKLTLAMTHAVVRRALAELGEKIDRPGFQLNFNIFPRDFSAPTLDAVFPPDEEFPNDFRVVVEIVETESLPLEKVQNAIRHLRERGIGTYIDDFGVGYSNMQNLAVLDVQGVKIDRSFAMAPDHSIMARILGHAIEMAHDTGRSIVIEGVETRERLDMLRANPLVDYAQGYYISRPLPIDQFKRLLEAWTPFGNAAQTTRMVDPGRTRSAKSMTS